MGREKLRKIKMMTVVDVRQVIASLFIMLKEDTYVLMRIEILVALVTAMFMVMFIMDFYRCRSRSSTVITALKTVDGLSDQIVVYLLGVMQSADFENHLFPVWALVLVSLRASLGYLSGYGIPDRERRLHEVANLAKFLGVGLLTGTRSLQFTKPLWSLWAILLLRTLYRFFAVHKAIDSLWHGRSSELLPEYMEALQHGDCEENTSHGGNGTICNDSDENHKYLIYGESRQKMDVKRPGYTLELKVKEKESLITLDKVLGCSSELLSSNSRYKDMSVAFTLSRLLRCRLEDVTLHRESVLRTQHLITSHTNGVLHMKDAERAFRILELELAFVRDYFYTLYPMVFWKGLLSLCFSLLLSVATFAVAFWLAIGIRKVYRPPQETFVLMAGTWNVDVVITWVFLFFMMFKEIWEVVTYLLSNWTRLLLVCNYVKKSRPKVFMEGFIRSIFKSKIADPWHRRIDQYEFLNSYTYKPTFWRLANAISMGKIPRQTDGKKRGEAIKIPPCVQPAIMRALRRIDLSSPQLPGQIPSLSSVDQFDKYSWACLKLHTCSQVILVWHIATSLCQIKFAEDHGNELSSPGFLRSAVSSLLSRCTSPDKKESKLSDKLKSNYHIANSLSRYCAYLQVFQPGLLPDSFVVPEVIFNETVAHARKRLTHCNSIRCGYNKLMEAAEDGADARLNKAAEVSVDARLNKAAEVSVDARLSKSIIQQGAILAKDLMKYEDDDESRWEILAGVWADLLVHIAPSWNAAEHKNSLEAGGEFITLIWALLWHCGIEKSSLWDKDEAPEVSPQAPRPNSTKTSRVQPMIEEEPNKEESEGSEEISNYRVGREHRNAQTDVANQNQRAGEAMNR